MSFREQVRKELAAGLKLASHTVQGYVPQGGITRSSVLHWVAEEIRIPNPHGGLDQDEGHLTLKNVPLPRSFEGVISAIENMVLRKSVGVLIGFRGSNLSFPHIIQFLHLESENDTRRTSERQPNVANAFKTAQPPSAPAPPPVADPGTQLPPSLPASPAAVAATQARADELRRAHAPFWARFPELFK